MWVEVKYRTHRPGLLVRQGKRYDIYVDNLGIRDEISLGGRGLMVLQAEHTELPDMQGTFLLLHLLTRVAFKLDASYSFINVFCVTYLDLEVKAFREDMCGCSSLGCTVRIDLIGRDCELEISEILLMVDPREGDLIESGVGAWYGHSPLLVSVG